MVCVPPARTSALLGAFLFFTLSPAWAQVERGELQVVVTDATGVGLRAIGALLSEAPQMYRTFTTDDSGRFTLQYLPFGVYRVVLERSGFRSYSDVVEIRSVRPTTLKVELALAPLTTEVEVSARPPLVDPSNTGAGHAIAAPQIRDQMPAIPGRRLLDLIDSQPGWLMEANGVLHPRGSEYQTLFVVDGVPMDENRSPAFAPDLQDDTVQAMTVLTGNFPAEYGRKLGGVVEISTAQDIRQGFHGSASLGGGSFGSGTGSFSGGYGWADRAVTFGVSAARTDRYLDPPVQPNFTNTGTFGGLTLRYDDRPSESDRVHLSARHRQTSFLVPNEILQQRAAQRQEGAGRETFGQAAWTRILSSQVVLNARGVVERLSSSLRSNPLSTPIVVSQDRGFTRGYANASVAAALGRHSLKFGGDVVFAPVSERLDYEITDESFFDDDTPSSFRFDDSRDDREQSLFVQDTVALGRLTVSAGLRWDHYALMVEDDAFSPRLGAAWSWPDANLVVRTSYDRVFQTPAFENLLLASSPLVDDIGDEDEIVRLPVLPSRGDFWEGGFIAGLWGSARLDVTAYRRAFDNFADDEVFLNTGVTFPVAFASAIVRGVDLKLTVLPVGRWNGFVSYGLLKGAADLPVVGGLLLGEEAIEELDQTGSVPITQDQRHTLRAQVRYRFHPRLWVAGTARYGSGLPTELDAEVDEAKLTEQFGSAITKRVDFERRRVQANVSVDAGFGAQLWERDSRRLTLRAEFANLTDRLNLINFAGLFSGTALGPPRSVSVRLQYEF